MKRDKLEELLHDKLNRIEIEPTLGVWAKLESDLESAGVQPTEQSANDGLPKMNIRMPGKGKSIGGRRKWMYVAASAAVIAVLIGTMRGLKEGVELEADKYEYTELYNPFEDKIETADQPQVVVADNMSTPTRVAAKRVAAEVLTEGTPETEATIHTEGDGIHTGIDTSITNADGESPEVKGEDTSLAAVTPKGEFRRASRRTSPVDLSLFASNFGGKSDSKSAPPGMMLTGSGFYVDEDSEGKTFANTNTRNYKHKLPLSFGVTFAINLTPKVAILTGVNYTYMLSEADVAGMGGASGAFDYSLKQRLHYIGVPVYVKYNFISGRRVHFYALGGGMLEKGVSGSITYRLSSEDRVTSAPASEKVKMKGLQASLTASLGVEGKLSSMFGIYVEPGVSYYFKNSNQPTSYRTINPLNFTLRAGLRMHF